MADCKYPHRVTIAMTDDMFNQVKQNLNMRYMMEDIFVGETDILLLNIVKAVDGNETNPIYLESVKESKK